MHDWPARAAGQVHRLAPQARQGQRKTAVEPAAHQTEEGRAHFKRESARGRGPAGAQSQPAITSQWFEIPKRCRSCRPLGPNHATVLRAAGFDQESDTRSFEVTRRSENGRRRAHAAHSGNVPRPKIQELPISDLQISTINSTVRRREARGRDEDCGTRTINPVTIRHHPRLLKPNRALRCARAAAEPAHISSPTRLASVNWQQVSRQRSLHAKSWRRATKWLKSSPSQSRRRRVRTNTN